MFGIGSKQKKLDKSLERIEGLYHEGDLESAEQELLRSGALAEELNDVSAKVVISNYLAGIYRGTNRLDQALEAAKEAFNLARENGEPQDRQGYYCDNVAQILERLCRNDESITHYEQAIELLGASEEPDQATMFHSTQAIARQHLMAGRSAEAEAALHQALQMAEGAGVIDAIMDASMGVAELCIGSGRGPEAVEILSRSRDNMENALREPRNNTAVIDPQAMVFEMMKEEFKEKGAVPLDYQGLLVQLSRARHMVGEDDGIPGNLPQSSDFEQRMYDKEPLELASKFERVAVALHFLAQESRREAAFDKAEEYYDKVLALIESAQGSHPAAADLEETTRENLEELRSDRQGH